MSSSGNVFEQPIPPSVKEILTAYAIKGDGDRDVLLAILHAKTAEDQRIAAIATLNDHMVQLQRQALEATVLATQHQALQQRQHNAPPQPSASHSPRSRAHNGNLPAISDDPYPSLAEGPDGRRRISNPSDSLRAPRRRLHIRDRGELAGSLPSPPISYLRTPSPSRNGATNAEAGPSALQKRKRAETPPSSDNHGLQDHPVDDPKRQRFVAITAPSSLSSYPPIVPGAGPSTREPISPSSTPPSPKPYYPTSHSRLSPPVHSRSVSRSYSRSPSPEKRSSRSDSPPIARRASRMDITSMLLGGPASSAADLGRTSVQLEWSSERSTTRAAVV